MIKRVNVQEIAFKHLLETSIKVPMDPEILSFVEEMAGQVEAAAMLAIQTCLVFGRTQEDACSKTQQMVEEYMQDPARSKYKKLVFDSLSEFIESEWEFVANPSS